MLKGTVGYLLILMILDRRFSSKPQISGMIAMKDTKLQRIDQLAEDVLVASVFDPGYGTPRSCLWKEFPIMNTLTND